MSSFLARIYAFNFFDRFILIFPLTFVSSAFVPPETMPGALQWFAEWNPFSITVNAIRALFIGDPAGNSVWGAVAWSVDIAALHHVCFRRILQRHNERLPAAPLGFQGDREDSLDRAQSPR